MSTQDNTPQDSRATPRSRGGVASSLTEDFNKQKEIEAQNEMRREALRKEFRTFLEENMFVSGNITAMREEAKKFMALSEKLGANILNAYDMAGVTPSITAAAKGRIDTLQFLIELGADPAITREKDQATAIMLAAWNGHADCVRRLVSAGVNINAQMDNGGTTLSWMALWPTSHEQMMTLCMDLGADPAIKDNTGESAADRWRKNAGKWVLAERLDAVARVNGAALSDNSAAYLAQKLANTPYILLRGKPGLKIRK